MRAEARTGGGRIRLDAFPFIQETFFVYLLQEIPQSLYISVVISDIGILHIHPITYAVGKVHPLPGIFHHLGAAGIVILSHTYRLAYILFGDAELFLHAEFHRESVGVPSGLSPDEISCLCLITADGILDAPGHYVMNARHSVGRRRTLEKYELGSAFAQFQCLSEDIVLLPPVQDRPVHFSQVQSLVFLETHITYIIFNGRQR